MPLLRELTSSEIQTASLSPFSTTITFTSFIPSYTKGGALKGYRRRKLTNLVQILKEKHNFTIELNRI